MTGSSQCSLKVTTTLPIASLPPSPFDVVTVHDGHEDEWSRFPPGWPHLVVVAESDRGLVYATRMRHLDGKLALIGSSSTDLQEAKLHIERLYIELALAARLRGGFYAADHVDQCRARLVELEAQATSRHIQNFKSTPHRQLSLIPSEEDSSFNFPLYYPHIIKENECGLNYFLGRRIWTGEVPFDPYSLVGWEDTASAAVSLAIKSLYKWTMYREHVAYHAIDLHTEACDRRGYDCVEPGEDIPPIKDDNLEAYYYKP